MTTEDLQLSRLHPSPVHLRHGKDKAADAELLDSIMRHGVLQPILVRPLTNGSDSTEALGFEVVAGHRRFEASKTAKLETIPALVRMLTDAEALELQVVENQQRSDVHPLEEAEGYRLLTEKHGYTVEQIAAKVGKSKAYVYGRMKLGALGKPGRAAFLEGELDAATALLVARIPEALQGKALKEIMTGGPWDHVLNRRGAMTYRQAVAHVQECYMLRLADAPFDTASESLSKAGPCGACIKRTGNQAELFGDVKGPDICTDPVCYRVKVKAAAAIKRAELVAEGKTILSAAQAKKIYPRGEVVPVYNSGYKQLDAQEWVGPRQVVVAALLRKHAPTAATVYCERPDGVLVELVSVKDLQRAVAKARPKSSRSSGGAAEADPRAARREAERRRREERADLVRAATFTLVLEKLPKAKDTVLWILLAQLMGETLVDCNDDERIERLFARHGAKVPADWNKLRAVLREIVGSDTDRARSIVLEVVMLSLSTEDQDSSLRDLVKHLRITPDQVKRRANAEQAAAAEREKQEKAKTKTTQVEPREDEDLEEDESGEEGDD